MPIKGVTDNVTASFPQIGTLHKGAARTPLDIERNRPGKDLAGFRFTSDYPECEKAFFETYGSEPHLLNVYLLHQALDENLESWREDWQSGGLLHRCDGETCVIWRKPDGTYSTEPKPCPGTRERTTSKGVKVREGCKPVTRLKVFLTDLRRAGYVLVQSSSIHDAISLTEQLTAIANETRGNLTGVPMILSRHPHKISTPGENGQRRRLPKSLLSIEISPTWIDLRLAALEAAQRPEVPQLPEGRKSPAPAVVFGSPPEDEDEDEEGEVLREIDADGVIHEAPDQEPGGESGDTQLDPARLQHEAGEQDTTGARDGERSSPLPETPAPASPSGRISVKATVPQCRKLRALAEALGETAPTDADLDATTEHDADLLIEDWEARLRLRIDG